MGAINSLGHLAMTSKACHRAFSILHEIPVVDIRYAQEASGGVYLAGLAVSMHQQMHQLLCWQKHTVQSGRAPPNMHSK